MLKNEETCYDVLPDEDFAKVWGVARLFNPDGGVQNVFMKPGDNPEKILKPFLKRGYIVVTMERLSEEDYLNEYVETLVHQKDFAGKMADKHFNDAEFCGWSRRQHMKRFSRWVSVEEEINSKIFNTVSMMVDKNFEVRNLDAFETYLYFSDAEEVTGN